MAAAKANMRPGLSGSARVVAVCAFDTGDVLASFVADGLVLVRGSARGAQTVCLSGARGCNHMFSDSGARLAVHNSAPEQHMVGVWCTATGLLLCAPTVPHGCHVVSCALSPRGTRVAFALHTGALSVWSVNGNVMLHLLLYGRGVCDAAVFFLDAVSVGVRTSEHTTVWTVSAVQAVKVASKPPVHLAANRCGTAVYAITPLTPAVRVLRHPTLACASKQYVSLGAAGPVQSARCCEHDPSVLVISCDGLVLVWDASTQSVFRSVLTAALTTGPSSFSDGNGAYAVAVVGLRPKIARLLTPVGARMMRQRLLTLVCATRRRRRCCCWPATVLNDVFSMF
jgi:hypothetical protein